MEIASARSSLTPLVPWSAVLIWFCLMFALAAGRWNSGNWGWKVARHYHPMTDEGKFPDQNTWARLTPAEQADQWAKRKASDLAGEQRYTIYHRGTQILAGCAALCGLAGGILGVMAGYRMAKTVCTLPVAILTTVCMMFLFVAMGGIGIGFAIANARIKARGNLNPLVGLFYFLTIAGSLVGAVFAGYYRVQRFCANDGTRPVVQLTTAWTWALVAVAVLPLAGLMGFSMWIAGWHDFMP